MTLTLLIPSLRRSIPDPLDPHAWPPHTSATLSDVVVEGVSLERLAGWCGTPCVHTGDRDSVVVVRVEAVEDRAEGIDVWVDAELQHCEVRPGQVRLIGRISAAPAIPAAVRSGRDASPLSLLPADVRAGDLLALPARGTVAHRDLRRDARHPERYDA